MKKTATLITLVCVTIAMTACSTTTGVTVTNPIKIGNQTVQVPSMTQPIIDAVDAACLDVPFNNGAFDRLYANKLQTLTIQQKADLDYFRAVCAKDKASRLPYEYGWIAGSVVDNIVGGIAPFLGKDAISAFKLAGLL
jgi:hypothetical protein